MLIWNRFRTNPWSVPIVSGVLILLAVIIARVFGSDDISNIAMTAAAVVAGTPIALKAFRALAVKDISIDLLVTVAAVGAIIIGEYWEAAAVTFLFAIGHALQVRTLNKTRSALAELVAVAPDEAIVLRDGQQHRVPAGSVKAGETVIVRNGDKVPVDGEVLDGVGTVDEASITGESIPVEKTLGDKVFAGTVSHSGFLQVTATGVGADTTLARIIHRVEEAQDSKAKTQTFIDKFSTWYTPTVMIMALMVGLFTQDVVLALTLLVISCPGALVISIPVSLVAGIGRAARDGILIKGGEFLESSAKVDAVALDKTGTITEGVPTIAAIVPLGDTTEDELLWWAAKAEAGSEHPLAIPVLKEAADRGMTALGVPDNTESVPGKGIVATVEQKEVLVGNSALLAQYGLGNEEAVALAEEQARDGHTPVLVAVGNQLLGILGIADKVRPGAKEMISELRASGIKKVVMLTGDAPLVAQKIGREVGIDEIHAGLLPEDKLVAVQDLQEQGYIVAMVGDGVNDAPALAVADAGIAMGAAGSGVAIETADIALMGDNLSRLPEGISLSKRTVAVMRQNIVIAVATVVALMLGVFFGGVTMAAGMLVHEASVLIVVANAMRLLRSRASTSGRNVLGSSKNTRQISKEKDTVLA